MTKNTKQNSPAAGKAPAAESSETATRQKATPQESEAQKEPSPSDNGIDASEGTNLQSETEAVPVFGICETLPIVVCGSSEALPLLVKAWRQNASPAKILPRDTGSGSFSDLVVSLMGDDDLPDSFILVPANCFPTHRVNLADLTTYRVRVFRDGRRRYDTRLPVLLEATAILATLELLKDADTFTEEEFFEKYGKIAHAGELPQEVGLHIGNTVAYVTRMPRCMAAFTDALRQKQFICTTAEGFDPIKERLTLLYDRE